MRDTLRSGMITKIHIAKADLGLDEDRYRAMLIGLTGKDSCKDMDLRELNLVYRQLEKDGFVVKVKRSPLAPLGGDKAKRKPENNAFQKKIWAMWFDLKDKGLVSGGTAALNKLIKRQTGIESIEWIKTKEVADPVIECLKAMQRRAK